MERVRVEGPQDQDGTRPAGRVRIGIVGWNYPEWKGLIYDDKAKPPQFLQQYARRFPIVEAASSYYGMPDKSSIEKWAGDTPASFEMSLKVPDWMMKKESSDPDLHSALGTFLGRLGPLIEANKLGTLVAQFPPFYRREKKAASLAAFVKALPQGPRWAVELRHDSWWDEETYAMLREANVTLVWSALGGDDRTPPVMTTDSLYLRLFGDRELEPPYGKKRRDATPELRWWAERIQAEGKSAKRVDVLVSKYLEGYAPGSAETLAKMLGVPPMEPPAEAAPKSRQMTFD